MRAQVTVKFADVFAPHEQFLLAAARTAQPRFPQRTGTQRDPLMPRPRRTRLFKPGARYGGEILRIVGPLHPPLQDVVNHPNIESSVGANVSSAQQHTDALRSYARQLAKYGMPLDDIAYLMDTDEATVLEMIANDRAQPGA